MKTSNKKQLPIIGWREWVSLPDLGVQKIKVKVDTGARSSSLHAFAVEPFHRNGQEFVRFEIHPLQRSVAKVVQTQAKVLEYRNVRSSSGKVSVRPVIVTNLSMMGLVWPVELTLANRDEMGFRMLLGREAFRRRFLIDAGRSYLGGGQPKRKIKKKKKKKHT
jgi:hypothetical protein